MKAKKYLQQLERLDTAINQKTKELEDLRNHSTYIGGADYSKSRVQTSHSGDAAFVNRANRLIDLEAEVKAEITKYADEKHTIINQIQSLQNSKHIEILYKRYVEFKRLEEVAVEMHFTYDYTKHLHGYALKVFEDKILNLTQKNT